MSNDAAVKMTDPLVLERDTLLIPVADLDDRTRHSVDCGPNDIVLSRPRSRSHSIVVDAEAASLINLFREPRLVVEAVVSYATPLGLDPKALLEDVYPLVVRLVENRFLVPVQSAVQHEQRHSIDLDGPPSFTIPGYTIKRPLRLMDDTEVYLLRDLSGRDCALKIARLERTMGPRFIRESVLLKRLNRVGPALIAEGRVGERPYLILEWCKGVHADIAADDIRNTYGPYSAAMLDLLRRVAGAYATLHRSGVIHGDVQPGNVLVDEQLNVRLVDFGFARVLVEALPDATSPTQNNLARAELDLARCDRAGVAFYHEPELAEAYLSGNGHPQTSTPGEQYSVAALLYRLLTGEHYVDFSLGRESLLRDVLERPPARLVERGLPAWLELENCLLRALSKNPVDRFPSMEGLVDALDVLQVPKTRQRADWKSREWALKRTAEAALSSTAGEAELFAADGLTAPTASISMGAAGIAYALYRLSRARSDGALLARADAWSLRAARLAETDPTAFVDEKTGLSANETGEVAPLHTKSGVAAVHALIAHVMGNTFGHASAIAVFLDSVEGKARGFDLTLGRASTLLGATLLLETTGPELAPLRTKLIEHSDRVVAELWSQFESKPAIAASDTGNLGIAHGWAGLLYATLLWSSLTDSRSVPPFERRLHELSELAEPSGRGLVWPWTITTEGKSSYMSGWCNGSAGYVFLWTLAHSLVGDTRFLDLACGAAWNVWESANGSGSLCCGLIGRAYALLNLYRHTQDRIWVVRARSLAERAAAATFAPECRHSLFRGEMALPVLAADIDQPDQARFPFFELEGWG